MLLHLGVRNKPANTYQRVRYLACAEGEGLAWPRMGWESGKARTLGAKLAGLAQVVPTLTLPHLDAREEALHRSNGWE